MSKKNATPAQAAPKGADGTKSVVALATAKTSPNGQSVSEEAVRMCAYRKWEAAGRPGGDGVLFWLDAERELSQGKLDLL